MSGELVLIEDNYDTQMIVRKILERREYVIRTASDGLTGLKLLEEIRPKVVLLDISLPEMDGMELARRVRQHENEDIRKTVLIALTAMGTAGDRDRFFDAGCDDHLPKPFRSTQLLEMVQTYISDNFVPGESQSPGGRRRKKLQEIAAIRTAEEERQRQTQTQTETKQTDVSEAPPAELKKMPGPKQTAKKGKSKDTGSFKMKGDFLSDLLDPGSVEPVDPPKKD